MSYALLHLLFFDHDEMDDRYQIEKEPLSEFEISGAFAGRRVVACERDERTGSIEIYFDDGTGLHVGAVRGDPAFFRMSARDDK
jgi:hypothetical protein